jgi:aldehyde:ferredoxin oxidoreductase
MEKHGLFAGKVLWVDLTEGRLNEEPLSYNFAQKYIGGWGMNARLAYDLIPAGMDAYDPEMPLIFGAGVLSGTPSPGSPKGFLTTKDAASRTVYTAVGGLLFATALKWAGYDHMVIKGKADKPVYLRVEDEDVEICDAGEFWGRDVRETMAVLKKRHGESASVTCIGPAGENMVPISMVFNDYLGTFGRSFGGNLGFRKLKALVVSGRRGARFADREGFMRIVDKLTERAMKDPHREKWASQGLYYVFPLWVKAGYFTTKNFTEVFPERESFDLYGEQHFNRVKRRVIGCPSCIAPDKFMWTFKGGELGDFEMMLGTPIDPPMSYGIRNEVGDFDKACWLFGESNRLGVDAMTLSALISHATDLYQRGIITTADTGGLEIKPGFESVKKLIGMTAAKEGFGVVLGEGFEGLIKRFGHPEAAYQIKGTEPDFDARASLGVEVFGSVVNPRGAHDMPVGGLTVAKGREPDFFRKIVSKVGYVPEDAMDRVFEESGFNVARLTAHYENWATILNCLGVCFRMQNSSLYNLEVAAELYSAGTGFKKEPDELLKDAERAYNVYKMANVREGFDRKDDRFPEKWFQPLRRPDKGEDMVLTDYFGRKDLTRDDVEKLLDDYYEEKGWDVVRGVPTRGKLIELGLETE